MHNAGGLAGPLDHPGHIADVNRGAIADANHDPLHVRCMVQEAARINLHLASGRLDITDVAPFVGGLNDARKLIEADTETAQPLGRYFDAELFLPAANDEALARAGHLLEVLHHLKRDETQAGVVDAVRPEGQGNHRHVVNGFRLHQRMRNPRRYLVHIGVDLVVEADK